MEINITWNICRVCLQEEPKDAKGTSDEQMRHIFNDDSNLAQHIYECSGITMKPNDNLPEKICTKCLTMVKNAVNFRKTCRASNTYLQSILQRTKSATTLFKPERSNKYIEEAITNNLSQLENYSQESETDSKNVEENEHSKMKKPKNQSLLRHFKNIKSVESLPAFDIENTTQLEANRSSEDLVSLEEEDVIDNDLDNAELEEIIEHSEELTDQIFASDVEVNIEKKIHGKHEQRTSKDKINDTNENPKPKISQLQKYYMSASYSKLGHHEEHLDNEIEETVIKNLKQDNQELYYLLKDIKTTHKNYSQDLDERDHIVTDNDIEFFAIEEDNDDEQEILRLEDEVDDNQAQVSSTVVTSEEIELHEQNSNLSNVTNDLDAEYIVDEYLIDSNSNISSQDSNAGITHSKTVDQKKVHSSAVQPRRKYKQVKKNCFSSSSTGRSHPKVSVCDICGNHFTNRHLMNIHMKVHRQEKNHECELCSKRFITACNLQAHMRTHTGEKPFECQYCGRRFSDRSSNLRHERTHTNEKPFQCDNCGKSFTLATTLQNHMKVHTGERSYRCEPCGKSFKLPHHLKTHQNTTLHKAVQQLGQIEN